MVSVRAGSASVLKMLVPEMFSSSVRMATRFAGASQESPRLAKSYTGGPRELSTVGNH
ncbi:MAG: hypothetical protein ACUVV6_08940 [Thermoplasmatota archaeon]